jgi:DNA invertase Pin-like site-specific DNA recombinase
MSAALGDVCSWGTFDSGSKELLGIAAKLAFRVVDNPSIDTSSRTGNFVMGILALIAEFENDIRRERQLDGIAKAKERGVRFGVQPKLTETVVKKIRKLRRSETVPEIVRQTGLSKASVYRALSRGAMHSPT